MPVISIGTTVSTIFNQNINREKLFLQNTGKNKIYFTKQKNGVVRTPTSTDYDFMLVPIVEAGNSNKIKDASAISQTDIHSIGGIKAVSEEDGSILAYFETVKVGI